MLLRTTKYYKVRFRTTQYYYRLLLHTTKHYSVPQSTTQYYSVLHSATPYYKVLHSTTPYYKVLHNTTSYYTVLQSTAQYYSVPGSAGSAGSRALRAHAGSRGPPPQGPYRRGPAGPDHWRTQPSASRRQRSRIHWRWPQPRQSLLTADGSTQIGTTGLGCWESIRIKDVAIGCSIRIDIPGTQNKALSNQNKGHLGSG